jgi:hypothetical protein
MARSLTAFGNTIADIYEKSRIHVFLSIAMDLEIVAASRDPSLRSGIQMKMSVENFRKTEAASKKYGTEIN